MASFIFFLLVLAGGDARAVFDTISPVSGPETKRIFDRDGDKIFENLFKEMNRASIVEQLPIIVVFKEKPDLKQTEDIKHVSGALFAWREYNNFPFMATTLTIGEIMALAAKKIVTHIEFDKKVVIAMDSARHWFGADTAALDFGLNGEGVVIAVLDSGIDGNHMDLDNGKIIGWKDFIQNRPDPYDDNGHGTSVSGVIAGDGDGNPVFKGVASGANLVGVKVIAGTGAGTMSTVVQGIDWCIDHRNDLGIDIINMSIAASGSSDGTDAASRAVNRAVAQGITVVAAAGNEGPEMRTIGTPAAAETAITAGSMADVGENGFFLAYFSSRGPTADDRIKPDVVATGWRLTCPRANSTRGYRTVDGTSFSSPFVAGAAALMLEANPGLTPADIKTIIQNTAVDWGDPGKDVEYGSGRLDIFEAVKQAGSYSGHNIPVPDLLYAEDNLPDFGSEDTWEFVIDDIQYPVAITLMENSTSCFFSASAASIYLSNIQIYLLDAQGVLLKEAPSLTRQANLTYWPSEPGIYRLKVRSTQQSAQFIEGGGNADYSFAVSGGLDENAGLILQQNQ